MSDQLAKTDELAKYIEDLKAHIIASLGIPPELIREGSGYTGRAITAETFRKWQDAKVGRAKQ